MFFIVTLLLSETVTTVNSINVWKLFRGGSGGGGGRKNDSGTCSAGGSCEVKSKPLRLSRIGRDNSPLSFFGGSGGSAVSKALMEKEVSCLECSHCLNKLRGGDGLSAGSAGNLNALATPLPLGLPLNAWKILFQIMLTSINVLCWLLPLRAKNFAENKLLLSLANAFSGGVFLSLAFGHLIPECVHGFEVT